MKIKDSIVVITGASGGIGLATARLMAKLGAKVVLAARSVSELRKLEQEIPNSFAVPTDMRNPSDIESLVEKVKGRYGRIDILVNNAGQGMRSPVGDIDLEDYQAIMDLNVFAVVRAMQAVIPIMRTQEKGLILNISSLVSKNYFPELGAYASTKSALNTISLTAREELKKDNIIVCVFHPKMTATNFGQNARGQKYSSSAGRPGMQADTPLAVAEAIVNQIESEDAEAMM
jgi:short-subunit dehydrogenase